MNEITDKFKKADEDYISKMNSVVDALKSFIAIDIERLSTTMGMACASTPFNSRMAQPAISVSM